jgi:hypothetical protein
MRVVMFAQGFKGIVAETTVAEFAGQSSVSSEQDPTFHVPGTGGAADLKMRRLALTRFFSISSCSLACATPRSPSSPGTRLPDLLLSCIQCGWFSIDQRPRMYFRTFCLEQTRSVKFYPSP